MQRPRGRSDQEVEWRGRPAVDCTAELGFLAETALGPEDLEVVNSKGKGAVTCLEGRELVQAFWQNWRSSLRSCTSLPSSLSPSPQSHQ